ncbi:winged helix-turn-helix domain-containing protein [Rhizobium sp. SSA_523]|uniref:winged helix-turn-helix domain-containing protein n=1 Tax=Rhizobium sp. SSA_523 TaxID=2952477 RepID=UPI002091995F|nr:winged helix-turn-helix domain-containing protein [Rhizobium sp. SSA_523]MCO5734500.1 winged helix-turn-helix domain-containing protein [Rhizobium sp. SSA_523]WKC23254.1 winged helix-turn-helix domain-containing protein [Rhizobium sp. SSA_523]
MQETERKSIRPVLRLDLAPEDRLGRGKIELLEHIRRTGSISAAGRAMDMSYRRAWLLVDALNHMFLEPAVEPQRGGKQGGGAQLTAFGERLIAQFREMERKAEAAIQAELEWLERSRRDDGEKDDRAG